MHMQQWFNNSTTYVKVPTDIDFFIDSLQLNKSITTFNQFLTKMSLPIA